MKSSHMIVHSNQLLDDTGSYGMCCNEEMAIQCAQEHLNIASKHNLILNIFDILMCIVTSVMVSFTTVFPFLIITKYLGIYGIVASLPIISLWVYKRTISFKHEFKIGRDLLDICYNESPCIFTSYCTLIMYILTVRLMIG